MQATLRAEVNLSLAGEVDDLILDREGRVEGIVLADGVRLKAGRVILTTGTFLRGLIHIGEKKIPAGRVGDEATYGLSRTLERGGFCSIVEDGNATAIGWPHY